MAATYSEVYTLMSACTLNSGKIPTVISMFSMSGKEMELECIMYLVSKCRIFKMAVAKPEIHVSQFVDMMTERFQWAYVFGDGQVKEAEFNHVPRERQ